MFGDPEPGLFTTPDVALFTSAVRTCAALEDGLALRYNAAAPAACGEAIDVPLIVFVAVVLVFQSDVMLTPGAYNARQVP